MLDELDFYLFQILIFQAIQVVKIKFQIDKKSSSSNLIFQAWFFKLDFSDLIFQTWSIAGMSAIFLLAPKDFRTFLRPGERGPGIRMTSGGWNGYLAKQAQTEEWRALFQYLLSAYLLCMIGVARFIWILIWKYEYQILIKKNFLVYYVYVKKSYIRDQ